MLHLWGSAIMHATYVEMKYTSTIYIQFTIQWEHRIVESGENGDTLSKIVAVRYNAVIYIKGHHMG